MALILQLKYGMIVWLVRLTQSGLIAKKGSLTYSMTRPQNGKKSFPSIKA